MAMLLFAIMWLLVSSSMSFVSPQRDPRALDALLQDYAYMALPPPKTGLVYDGKVPKNLTGVKVSAIRLRTGSLRRKGISHYKEFRIPRGLIVSPYIERIVLIYQNLGNLSVAYYPLRGHVYLAPVVGLLAYDASNLTARDLPELGVNVSLQPISVRFYGLRSLPEGSKPKCVSFRLNGSVGFSHVAADDVCSTFEMGHFSVAVESSEPPGPGESGKSEKGGAETWVVVVGSVVGGSILLVVLGVLVISVRSYSRRKKLRRMEGAADVGEALHVASVGGTRAPAATGTRTQPIIETEYVP